MNMSDYDYLRAIWHQFYGPVASDPVANEQHHHLSQKLDPDLRKELAGKWYSFEKDEERQIRHVP